MTKDMRWAPALFFCIFLFVGAYFFTWGYGANKGLTIGDVFYVIGGVFLGIFLCVLGLSLRKDKEGRNMWERFKNKE